MEIRVLIVEPNRVWVCTHHKISVRHISSPKIQKMMTPVPISIPHTWFCLSASLYLFVPDLLDKSDNLLEVALASSQISPGSTHAETGRAGSLGCTGSLENLASVEHLLGLDDCGVAGRLGAVLAVLTASSGLDAQKGALLNGQGVEVEAVDIGLSLERSKKFTRLANQNSGSVWGGSDNRAHRFIGDQDQHDGGKSDVLMGSVLELSIPPTDEIP